MLWQEQVLKPDRTPRNFLWNLTGKVLISKVSWIALILLIWTIWLMSFLNSKMKMKVMNNQWQARKVLLHQFKFKPLRKKREFYHNNLSFKMRSLKDRLVKIKKKLDNLNKRKQKSKYLKQYSVVIITLTTKLKI